MVTQTPKLGGDVLQGAGFGYSQVRGLYALLATVTASGAPPVIVTQRLRKGALDKQN